MTKPCGDRSPFWNVFFWNLFENNWSFLDMTLWHQWSQPAPLAGNITAAECWECTIWCQEAKRTCMWVKTILAASVSIIHFSGCKCEFEQFDKRKNADELKTQPEQYNVIPAKRLFQVWIAKHLRRATASWRVVQNRYAKVLREIIFLCQWKPPFIPNKHELQ